tara:strand:+ start:3869 stop:4870 length:1002 start_codon:yes stop_codon:yes gene_type:complete
MALAQFDSALTQQSNSAYEANFTALTGEDNTGSIIGVGGDNGSTANYIFDFFTADVSMTVDPSFAVQLTSLAGLSDVSAIAQVQTPVESFDGLISLILDSSDIDDLSANDIRFMVNSNNPFSSFNFSDSSIKFGAENTTYSDQSIPSDMVRHIAKDITGGYAVADIFTNEKEMRDDIISLDASLVEDISSSINDLYTLTSPATTGDQGGVQFAQAIASTGSGQAMFFTSVHTLFSLTMAASVGANDNAKERFLNFLEDISNDGVVIDDTGAVVDTSDVTVDGTDPAKFVKVPLRFVRGDAIAIRINYRPASDQPVIGNNPINERSYKVLIELA